MKSPKPLYHLYGIKTYCIVLIVFLVFLTPSTFYSQTDLAFPSAAGAGAYATGGRGKPVYIVTNLNNSGTGSFRQALEDTKTTDGGIITFSVSGTIVLTSILNFRDQDNITIAGQTAPDGGITISSANSSARFGFRNVNNFIMRYVRVRPNFPAYPATEIDGLILHECNNYIIDHCSFSWGTDENTDAGIGNTYTWQRNLFADSNKTGMIMGAQVEQSSNFSFLNNMFYNISHRFPNFQSNERVDVINNLIWNFRSRLSVPQGGFEVNHMNNYYQYFRDDPPAEEHKWMLWYPFNQSVGGNTLSEFPTIYTSGNYISNVLTDPNADNYFIWRWRNNPSGSQYSGVASNSPLTTDFKTDTQFPLLGVPFEIKSAVEAMEDIRYNVGANVRLDENGDAIEEIDGPDSIYLSNVQNNIRVDYTPETNLSTAHFDAFQASVSTTPINTHPPSFDTNNDGIPDQWVLNQGFAVDDDLTTHLWESGYVGIEEYLNGVDFEILDNNGSQVLVSANFETICEGEDVILTASGADSYTWDNNGETSTNITVSPTQTTTYTVTGSHSDGSTTEAEITITVNEIPIANAGNDVETCQGTPVTLTASGGTSYEWSNGAETPTITVSPSSTTTYSVEVTQNGCSSTDDVVVTVNEIPTVDAGLDETIFIGESVTLTATGADSYLWSTGATTQSITVNPILDTSYSVTGTTNNCEDTDSVTVFLQDDSVNANAGVDAEICIGETITLTATGGTTYLWNTGETTSSITVSPTTTTAYTVTVFSISGTNSEDDSVIVSVNSIPVAEAGNDVEICFGNSTTLTASGGSTYLWSNGATTSSITVNPNETTTYSVEVFENNCSSSDDITVTVNALPNTNAGTNVTINPGESTTLTATGAETYLWSTGETTATITVSPNNTTTYSVTGFSGDCESSDDVIVSVETETITANAGADVSICNGESTTLEASGGTTYLWSTGETTASISVNPNTTTTYTVTAFNASETVSDDDSIIVTVNTLPSTNAGNDVTIPEGESTTLTASGADTYLWSTGATTSSITVTPNSTTIYTVTGFSNGCEVSDDITVSVETENVTANAGTDVSICSGENATLTASGGTTYQWSTGETSASISVSPNATTTYTVTAFNTAQTASDEDTVTVTVNALPTTNAGGDVTITEGESTTLTASGADTYLWSTGETTTSISVTPETTTIYAVTGFSNGCEVTDEVVVTIEAFEFQANAGANQDICQGYETTLTASEGDAYLWSTGETTQSITVNPSNTQTFTVTVFIDDYQDDADVTVSVNPNPNVVITNGSDVTILEGEFITLSAGGANTYLWNNGATQPNIAVSPSITTTYEVTGFINNCEDTTALIVNVVELVEADAGEDLVICNDETVTLTANGGDEYLWNTGETTQSIEVAPNEDTEYSVLVYNALDSDEDTVIVFVEQCTVVNIPPETEEFGFTVYQDPIYDVLKINIDGLQSINATGFTIYDLSGKQLYTEVFNQSELQDQSEMTKELDTSMYSQGIYIVRLIYDDTSLIKKVPIR